MPSKFFLKSGTIVSALIGLLGFVSNLFHVSVADLLPALTVNLDAYVNDTLTLAGFAGTIVGRFRATQTLHVAAPTSPANSSLVAAATILLLGLGLAGCVSTGASAPGGTSAVGTSAVAATPAVAASPGINWSAIQTKIDAALTDVAKSSAGLQQSGLVPAGKISDTVNDANTIAPALQTAVTGAYVDPADAVKIAQSFHSDKATTNYVALGVLGADMLAGLTKDLIASGASSPQVKAAQTQAVVGFPNAVQQGVTPPVPTPITTGTVSL